MKPRAPTREQGEGAVGGANIEVHVPEQLVEAIAKRVAELLRSELDCAREHPSPWLDLDGASGYLRVSRDTLYKLTAARAIPFRKKLNGQGLRFHRDELDGWMETHYPRLDRLG